MSYRPSDAKAHCNFLKKNGSLQYNTYCVLNPNNYKSTCPSKPCTYYQPQDGTDWKVVGSKTQTCCGKTVEKIGTTSKYSGPVF